MSLEAWGDESWGEVELPDGCWDEITVDEVKSAIQALCEEPIYSESKKENGISERFLARLTLLKAAARMLDYRDHLVVEAENIVF